MDKYRVKPGTQVDLGQWDPDDKSAFDGDKSDGAKAMEKLNRRLEALQELLFAEGKRKVLIVLQRWTPAAKMA